jgi:N-methylhydantoinase B/oxoprolinase/acetone carboxylase alpha subunit
VEMQPDDVFVIETPGGGGYGAPSQNGLALHGVEEVGVGLGHLETLE